MGLLDDIRTFERVATTGSFSMAGRDLRIATSGVSKRVSDLEARIGVRLLHRSTRGIHLTEEGGAFLNAVRRVLDEVDALEVMFRHESEAVAGTLRLTGPARFSERYIVPLLPDFLALHPNVTVDLSLTDQYQDLIRDGLDMAIRIGNTADSGYMIRKLFDNRRILCASPDYLSAHGRPRAPAELENHDCLVVGDKDVWQFERGGQYEKVRVRGRIRCRHGDVVGDLCLRGVGVALKSLWDVHEDIRAGRLVAVLDDYRIVDDAVISVLMPDRVFVPPKVRSFVDFIETRIGRPPVWERDLPAG